MGQKCASAGEDWRWDERKERERGAIIQDYTLRLLVRKVW